MIVGTDEARQLGFGDGTLEAAVGTTITGFATAFGLRGILRIKFVYELPKFRSSRFKFAVF